MQIVLLSAFGRGLAAGHHITSIYLTRSSTQSLHLVFFISKIWNFISHCSCEQNGPFTTPKCKVARCFSLVHDSSPAAALLKRFRLLRLAYVWPSVAATRSPSRKPSSSQHGFQCGLVWLKLISARAVCIIFHHSNGSTVFNIQSAVRKFPLRCEDVSKWEESAESFEAQIPHYTTNTPKARTKSCHHVSTAMGTSNRSDTTAVRCRRQVNQRSTEDHQRWVRI